MQPQRHPSYSLIGALLRRWKMVFSWMLFIGILAGSVFWLMHEDKRAKPVIPPTVRDNMITFSDRPEGIRSESVDAGGAVETGYPGRLAWAEDRTSRVRSPFNGRIVRAMVKVGDRVQPGQALAEIQSADYARAEADYQLADSSLQRANLLYRAGILSKRELQTAEGDYKRARAEFLRSQPTSLDPPTGVVDGNFVLRSPIAGVIAEMSLNPGQEIRAEQDTAEPLFLITDPSQLWVWVDLGELDMQQLQSIQIPFPVSIQSLAFSDHMFQGTVVQLSEALNPTTRTFRLRGVVQNTGRQLKGEMYVTVGLRSGMGVGGSSDRLSSIPSTAVFLVGETRYVFVQQSETSYARREIRVIREIAGRALVTGLDRNQRVVTDGNLYMQQILLRAAAGRTETPGATGGRP